MNAPDHNRARNDVVRDLRAGLGALSRIADDIEHRPVNDSDIAGLDAMSAGLQRLCIEWRALPNEPDERAVVASIAAAQQTRRDREQRIAAFLNRFKGEPAEPPREAA
jgi:hypothetical protein